MRCTPASGPNRGIAGAIADILFLDLQHMTVEVPQYFAECGGNPLPPEKDRRKVVFVCQSNGFAELWGVCVEDVAGHQAGAGVKLDSEVGEFEPQPRESG